MLAFRETKFSRSCRQSYTRLRNGRWLISRSRRLRLSRCWKRRTDYQQNFKAKSRSLTVIRKRRGLVRDDTVTPANLLGLANTKEKQIARFVLVHGGFSGAWIWLPLMDRLKAAGHVVEAFDLPGMGNDNTSASEVSLESYAGRVCEVLAANSEPAVVVGHSMGGIVATQAASCRGSGFASRVVRVLRGQRCGVGDRKAVHLGTFPNEHGAWHTKKV